MTEFDHLKCPFCRKSGEDTVYIQSKELLDRHFDDTLPLNLECRKCGATGRKVAGCCSLRYEWKKKPSASDYDNIRFFRCSDCNHVYYAEIVERNGRFEIGREVDAPPYGIKVREQRMLCGNCQGKGGKGDRLNDLINRQRRELGQMLGELES